jgi:hypothetical protein
LEFVELYDALDIFFRRKILGNGLILERTTKKLEKGEKFDEEDE